MFCKYCCKEFADGSAFCKYCGKALSEGVLENTSNENALLNEPIGDEKSNEPFTPKEIGILIAAGVIVILLIILVIRFWQMFFLLVFLGAGIFWWVKASPEQRQRVLTSGAKEVIQGGVGLLVIILLVLLFVPGAGYWADAFLNGKGIPTSQMPNFSNSDNIGTAFYEYFDGGDWDNYKSNGTQYVTFSGDYMSSGSGEVDVVFVFELSNDGESFRLYDMTVNGSENGFASLAILGSIFE